MTEGQVHATTWRTSDQLQVVCGLLYFLYAGIAAVALANAHTDRSGEVVFVVVAIVGAYANSAIAFSPLVRLDGTATIVVKNPLLTRRVPIGAVESIDSLGLSFLTLRLTNGRSVTCWAIQATNAMLALGKRTRVDEVADEVRTAIGELPADLRDAKIPVSLTPPSVIFWIFLALVLAAVAAFGR